MGLSDPKFIQPWRNAFHPEIMAVNEQRSHVLRGLPVLWSL
ncbi:hypothetical protein LEMLEM_LOCUS20169 [Lemmus lemmus]